MPLALINNAQAAIKIDALERPCLGREGDDHHHADQTDDADASQQPLGSDQELGVTVCENWGRAPSGVSRGIHGDPSGKEKARSSSSRAW